MRILADENIVPAHVSALDSAGHDVRRVDKILEKGVSDDAVLEAARQEQRVVLTYDKKDFSEVKNHVGVLLADETTQPREIRAAIDRIASAYSDFDVVVEYLSDWQ